MTLEIINYNEIYEDHEKQERVYEDRKNRIIQE